MVQHVKGGWSPNVPHKVAWGSWGRFIKLKHMEHACTALSEADMAAHAHLNSPAHVLLELEALPIPAGGP